MKGRHSVRLLLYVVFALGGVYSSSVAAGSANGEVWPSRAPWAERPDIFRVVTRTADGLRSNSDVTPSVLAATPAAFVEMLSDGKVMPAYNETQLRSMVEQYNIIQHKRFGVASSKANPADFLDGVDRRPKGYSLLEFADWGAYFIIFSEVVEETHTADIDGGRDSYTSTVFTKNPVKMTLELPGPIYPLLEKALVLLTPMTYSCMGHVPEGKISVHDLRSDFVFQASLPNGTYSLKVDDSTGGAITLIAASDEPSSNSGRHTCDVGLWVRKIETTLSLTCSSKKRQCAFRRIGREILEGCQDVGACE